MSKSARSKAEERFAAAQKKNKEIGKDKEKAQQQRADQVARLRSLRLAKEAADKEGEKPGDTTTPDEATDDTKPKLPQAHQPQW